MKSNVKRNLFVAILSFVFAISLSFAVGNATLNAKAEDANEYITGASVTLNDSIVAKYYVAVPTGYTQAKMTFTYKGETYESTQDVSGLSAAVFEFDKITPQNMTENVAATVEFTADGQAAITETNEEWSIASYCQKILAAKPDAKMSDTEYAELKALAVNLLNYGDKAQAYTEKEGDLPTAFIESEEDKALIGTIVPTSDAAMSGTASDSVSWAYAYLTFDSKVNMAFEFWTDNAAMETYQEVTTISITPANGVETVITSDNFTVVEDNGEKSLIKAVWEGVSVVEFDETVTAQIKVNGNPLGYALTYSVASYVASMQNSQNAAMKELATAVYNYGLAAGEYTQAQEIEIVGVVPLDGWYKSYYVEGEKFNPNGMKIGYQYSDNSVSGDVAFTCDTETALTSATQSVTVTADGYSVDLPITVVGASSVLSIEAEYGVKIGTIETVATGGTLDYASNRSYLRNFEKNSSVTYTVTAAKATTGSVRLYLASHEDGYNGDKNTSYPLTPAEYLKATFNGTEVAFGKYEVLPSTTSSVPGVKLCNWYAVTFDNLTLKEGVNTFTLTSLEDLSLLTENLHSTAFDKLEVLYADETAIPQESFAASVRYEAETYAINATTAGKYGTASSNQSSHFSNETFIKDPAANGKLILTVNATASTSVTLTMTGVSTSNNNVDISKVVNGLTVNGVSQTYTAGVCFTANGGNFTVDKHSTYTFGTYTLKEGINVIVISFVGQSSGSGNAFIDYVTLVPEDRPETAFPETKIEAENATLSGFTTVTKNSGVIQYASGNAFIKDSTAGATVTLTIDALYACKAKLTVTGISTSTSDVAVTDLISGLTVNEAAQTFADGVCFTKGGAPWTAWSTYEFGTYDLQAGTNTIVITFNASSAAFYDYFTISPVTEAQE